MQLPMVFIYQSEEEKTQHFRTVEIDGEYWFYAKDVCEALGIANGRQAVRRLDTDDIRSMEVTNNLGREAKATIVSEAGLYQLIFQSRKEGAEKFKRWVTHEVLPSIRRTGGYGISNKPFIRRFNENWNRVTVGYFSVISELNIRLYGRLEQLGYTLKDHAPNGREIRPDVSVGRLFSKNLSLQSIEADYEDYLHWTQAGEFPARQYRNKHLPEFIRFIDEVWIPEHAEQYFKTRDPNALPYLPQLLPPPPKKKK